MIRRVVALVGAAGLLAACGGGDGGRFDDQVAAVRQAVEAGDREAALSGLDEITLLALDGRQQGELTEAELAELAALVEQGRALVDEQLPAPVRPAPPPAPAIVESADDDRDDDDRDDDRGEDEGDGERGKGKGKGRGDD